MSKRTMPGYIAYLRRLSKARRESDPEAASALRHAAEMLEASMAVSAALMAPARLQ